jgi:hypothetical protein
MSLQDFIQSEAAGLSEAAGAADTAKSLRGQMDDRRATAHEELEANTHSILDDVRRLQDRRASLDPKSPTYQKDIADNDTALHDARMALTKMYHPDTNPGALAHLGSFIKSHLGKQPSQGQVSTPAEARQRLDLAGLDARAAGPGKTPATPQNPILVKRQQMKEAGYSDEDIARAEHREPATPPGAPVATPTTPPAPVKKTSDERPRDDFAEWKNSHKDYKGTFEEWKYKITHPDKPGKPPAAPHLTPAQNHAQVGYIDALKLSKVADDVAKKPNDAVNQKRLAVALERISAGRFTTQALDYIVKAGWAASAEQFWNNIDNGTLPETVIRQLVDGAHQNLQAAKDVLKEADDMAPKIPTTTAEARKRVKPSADPDDDEFLKKF